MATAERNDEAPNSAPLGAMGSLLRRLDMLPCTDDAGSISELKDYIHSISDKLKKLSEVQDPPLTVNYWMKHARELSYDIEAYLDGLDAQTEDSLNDSDAKEGDDPDDSYAKMKDCINNSDDETECSVDDSHAEMEDNPDDSDANMEDSIDDSDEDETEETVDNSDSSMQDSICSSDYKISGFRTRAKGMIDRYEKFSLDSVLSCPTAPTTIVSPRPSRDVVLVGMGNQITKLISLLQPKDENGNQLKIVSILGDEGIGKSTLIQEIWRESLKEKKIWPEPQSEVKVKRAFVRMGKKPDVRMILQSILSQVSQQEPAKDCGVTNLIRDIRKHLEQKRYFIIVDDVQSLSVWDVVGRAFPHGSFGSRIITTTSDKEVALACCSYVLQHNYIMEPLSVGDCKELFIRTVGMGTVDLQLSKQVLDEIKRKYGGLPLAIIWTANLVASKLETEQGLCRSEKEQNLDFDVMKFLDEYLRTASTPVEILIQILKLCYSSLPHYLKTCLLYLSLYPENYVFLKKDLVKLWIAEGFICTSEEDKVEAAGRYFDVLVSLGLIQRMDINCNKQHQQGELVEDEGEEYPLRVPYVVHPTVFDFITSKSTEDNFISIIDYSQLTIAFKEKIRRLSLHFGSATYATTPASIGLSQVRTLSFIGLLSCMPSLVEFKLVRVLFLHLWADNGDKNFQLAEICKLFLLKYLQVRCNVNVELPGQIGCLKHLETLEINSVVTAVPSDVFHLSRLLHLRLGLKQNLTLGPVATTNAICSDELLPPMDDSSSTSTPSVQIFELVLPICIFSRLPKWIPQLRKLSILEIVVGELFTTDIDMLEDLPALTALSLCVRIPTAGNIVFRRGAFQALKYFRFMCGVLSLDFQEEAVPNLRRLNIGFNVHTTGQKYDNILVGFQHLLNIQDVVAIIGAAMGMEETDRIAAESALKDAINKHPRPIKFKVKRELHVEEEYHPPPDRLSINEQEVPVIHGPKTEDSTNEQPINLDKMPGKDTHGIPQFSDLQEDDDDSTQQKSGSSTQTLLTLLADAEEQARQLGEMMTDDPWSRAEGAVRRLQCTLGKAAGVVRAVEAAAPGSSSQGTDRSNLARSADESSCLTTAATEVQERQSIYKRRKGLPRWTTKLRVPDASLEATPDDGFSWRKYGQKDILGAKFPRGYYRCTYRTTQACAATKLVQRSDTDLCVFDVAYQGEHTCHQKQRATVAAAAYAGGSQSAVEDGWRVLNVETAGLHDHGHDRDRSPASVPSASFSFPSLPFAAEATDNPAAAAAAFSPPASSSYFPAPHPVVVDGSCYADVYGYDEATGARMRGVESSEVGEIVTRAITAPAAFDYSSLFHHQAELDDPHLDAEMIEDFAP